MITSRGIEANPEKCKAIIQMQSPQTVKDVQRLAGRLVSLSHFIPRLAEKVGPIFTLLRKLKNFEWTNQCEKAFKNFKVFLTTLPVLQRPDYHVDLLLYLVMAEGAISAVIMIEKLALALVTAARRLRPYFQSHQVVVKIDYPIKQILRKLELSERMIAWSVELSEFGIRYESRGPLKAQCLAEFMAELTPTSRPTNNKAKVGSQPRSAESELQQRLKAHGRVAQRGISDQGCLIAELPTQAKENRISSRLLLHEEHFVELQESLKVTSRTLTVLSMELLKIINPLQPSSIKNARANLLSKLASTKSPGQNRTIIQETLNSPSLDDKVANTSDNADQGWMADIWNYLKQGILPENNGEARKIRVRSAKFIIVGDELFKRGISTPLLKCLTEPQATYVIEEIHRGICGMHSGARSMATRVLRDGYY
ncbi:uncharacterized protein LOC109800025 [Cajanus cajan]|uniref:uncharacterized protein LOC109800025 n=1 Tax=Cajanus cajan TaxID=3821 RepID=UPI00098D7CB9|nr:uncharacterized protein LOC109800025 [Cajanus cajan]